MDVAEIQIEQEQTLDGDRVESLLAHLADRVSRREIGRGQVLWHQSDESDELAFVLEGELEIFVSGRRVGDVGTGELLGEASMFGALQSRTATVRASRLTTVGVLTRAQVISLRSEAPELYDRLLEHALQTLAVRVRVAGDRLLRLSESSLDRPSGDRDNELMPMGNELLEAHARQVALRSLEIFAGTNSEFIEDVANSLISRVYESGEIVLEEGEVSRGIYLVANGSVDLICNIGTRGAVPVTNIGRGRLFGLLGAVLDTPRSGTIVAQGSCWLLEMPFEVHSKLGGEPGRVWREALVAAARAEIQETDRKRVRLEVRREALIQGKVSSSNVNLPVVLNDGERAMLADTVDAIIAAIGPHRRLLPDSGSCAVTACPDCFGLHRDKLENFVAAGAPVHMILPAYPAKSPNAASKVLGRLPDMAEEQSLLYLQRVCDEIAAVYEPGGRVTICSDGRVFSDLVLVSDEDISDYGREIDSMLERLGLDSIDVFAIEDLFEVTTFEGMRDHLAVHYGDELEALRDRARIHPQHRSMYNGIHRFLFEDSVAVESGKSRTKIRKECAERAYGVIQRSNAFSRLIAECFPEALRLSIHPQPAHAAKVGILLGTASDAWITPWHGVAVLDGAGYHLMKREAAESLGATLVHRSGRPSHYEVRHEG